MFADLIPADVAPPWFYVAMAFAVVIIGVAKSGFGGGVGVLAVPLTANVLPTFGGAAIGIALGTALVFWFKAQASDDIARQEKLLSLTLKLAVGGLCLGLVLIQCYRMTGLRVPRIPDNRPAGFVAGGLSGFVSMLTHGAGPIMSIYLLEHRLDKRLLVGTLVVFFFVVNTAKVPSYLVLGWIDGQTFAFSALCFLLVPVGSLLGMWMHRRIPERPFTLIMYLGAAAAAGNMIYSGIVQWPSTSPS